MVQSVYALPVSPRAENTPFPVALFRLQHLSAPIVSILPHLSHDILNTPFPDGSRWYPKHFILFALSDKTVQELTGLLHPYRVEQMNWLSVILPCLVSCDCWTVNISYIALRIMEILLSFYPEEPSRIQWPLSSLSLLSIFLFLCFFILLV